MNEVYQIFRDTKRTTNIAESKLIELRKMAISKNLESLSVFVLKVIGDIHLIQGDLDDMEENFL